jgi:hypothetical protein
MDSTDPIVEASEQPKVADLIADYRGCTPADGSWNRWQTNEEVRYALWAGQTCDGKKHDQEISAATGGREKAFPFDGASDTRIFMADEVINEIGDVLYAAFWRAMAGQKMSLEPQEVYALKLLDYFLNEVMTEELLEEVDLAAQYRGTYGYFFLHPRWAREVALERQEVKLEQLVAVLGMMQQQQQQGAGMGGMGGEEGAEPGTEPGAEPSGEEGGRMAMMPQLPDGQSFILMLMDPEFDKVTVEVLAALHQFYAQGEYRGATGEEIELPPLSKETLREAVRDLRTGGAALVPVPYVCRDELELVCLKPWEEVVVSGSAADMRKARVYHRMFLDEVSLRRKIIEEGWDADWVEAALTHKGKSSQWGMTSSDWRAWQSGGAIDAARFGDGTGWTMCDAKNDLVEVIYASYWALDRDNVPGVFCTVFHPEIGSGDKDGKKGSYATHGLLDEGEIPYVCGRREVTSRRLTSSRGVPEIAMGWQREKKVLRDSVVDLTSIAVMPPLNVYAEAMGTKYRFGPAVQNTVRQGREPRFMEIPKGGAPLAWEASDRVDHDKRRYFGLLSAEVPETVSQARQQKEANSFLMTWTKALKMGLRLAQLNMSDAQFAQVTGAPAGWLEARRKQKGLFGVALNFDVRELNPEFVLKQLEVLNQVVVPGDTTGAIDRRMLTQLQLHAINPRLARVLIKDQTSASQEMFDEVQNDVAMMFLGNAPKPVENDPAAAQKMQFTQQIVQSNPTYLSVLQSQPEGRFAQLLQFYAKNLNFSMTQQKNSQIGRIGVDPAEAQAAGGAQAQPPGQEQMMPAGGGGY